MEQRYERSGTVWKVKLLIAEVLQHNTVADIQILAETVMHCAASKLFSEKILTFTSINVTLLSVPISWEARLLSHFYSRMTIL